jgi:hypothetical protein
MRLLPGQVLAVIVGVGEGAAVRFAGATAQQRHRPWLLSFRVFSKPGIQLVCQAHS